MSNRAPSSHRRRKGHPEHIGAALEKLARSIGIDKTLGEHTLLAAWGTILGERIAAVTTARRIENGILYVTVSTAPWRAELAMQRKEIMQRLNAVAGKDVVKDIKFR